MSAMGMRRQFSHFRCRKLGGGSRWIDIGAFLECYLSVTSLLQAGNKSFKRGVAEVR
jgi:hypothetical protein